MILNLTIDTQTDADLARRVVAALGGEQPGQPVQQPTHQPEEIKTVPLQVASVTPADEVRAGLPTLDELSFAELKAEALRLGLDTEGKKSAGLRRAIQEHLENPELEATEDDDQPLPDDELAQAAETPADDDLLGGDEDYEDEAPRPKHTKQEAVKRASQLVNAGQTAEVRAVLSDLGAKRVSDLDGLAIDEFMAAVKGL